MQFITEHNKFYETVEEFNDRYEIFKKTDKKIEEMNSRNSLATFGHNFLSDWDNYEFMSMMGLKDTMDWK